MAYLTDDVRTAPPPAERRHTKDVGPLKPNRSKRRDFGAEPTESVSVMTSSTVGVKILSERRKRRWTQTKLAQRAGITRETIYKIEKGQVPQAQTIKDLAKALGISTTRLSSTTEPMAPNFCLMLRERRRSLGLSLRVCSLAAGISQVSLSNFERGLVVSPSIANYDYDGLPVSLVSERLSLLLNGYGVPERF